MRHRPIALVLAALPLAACSGSSDSQTPGIVLVNPAEGPVTGGTSVQIVTAVFDDFTANLPLVTFGGVAAPSVSAAGPNEVTVTTPPGAAEGVVDVQVTSSSAPLSARRPGGFRYLPSPPAVIGLNPPDLATDVPVTSIPGAIFDRDMDPASFGPGSITLDGMAAGPLAVHVEFLSASRTLRALPVGPLPLGDTVTATVADTAQDLQGRAMQSPRVWSFQTTADPAHLLITEVAVTDASQEFVEIHNPTSGPIDLDGYHLADSTWIGPPGVTQYYLIPQAIRMGTPVIGTADDFAIRFPPGATIGPGEYQTISLAGGANFESAWLGVTPTYEIPVLGASLPGVPDMEEVVPGSIGTTARLTNGGELVVLFFWNGASDKVYDVDYVTWGDAITDPTTPEAVDKTGVALDGPDPDSLATAYLDDTPLLSQEVIHTTAHTPGNSFQRLSPPLEVGEGAPPGNGITGHDETSERLGTASGGWTRTDLATPNQPGP